jgi:hypothetical protein
VLLFNYSTKISIYFVFTNYLTNIFLPALKKEQKNLIRLKFTAKKPQREHNTRLAKKLV